VILDHWTPESVILVDDAGLFVGKDNYPTLEEVKHFVTSKNLGLKMFVDKGIIHIL
jgi:pyrimidine operon attenuation protein/uracil phosphoribosyltransferase